MNLLLLNNEDFSQPSSTCVRISDYRYRHILTVLKAQIGDKIKSGHLNGLMGEGTITAITDAFVELDVTLDTTPPPPLQCTLIVALPRPKSLRKVIECSVSLGIKKIYLIGSYRVEKSFWNTPFLKPEQMNQFIINGLEQAKDTVFPEICTKRFFKPFVEDELPLIAANSLNLVAHPYDAAECPSRPDSPVTLVIGPEGGFIPFEINILKRYGFQPVTTGGRILRVEYAIPTLIGRLF
ncbi:MAG TPA: 16S rRNA (uracil(1498)-N(3))-methyltransferase [Chitinispirillaceae bacterium]|nr:16S rRNA (uracil(1498)-N(3))-methyltransferase [Chitinispirillaceae bacterium]